MNHLDEQLITAIEIANIGHEGQYDKAGEPYILHPLRLMSRTTDRKEQIVSVLHDLIEDTPFTLDSLVKYEFDEDIVEAVDCLTRKKYETYDQFIERISKNELATKVKIMDLEDNLDASRLKGVTQKDVERIQKYSEARIKLMNFSKAEVNNIDILYHKYDQFMHDWINHQESLNKNKL